MVAPALMGLIANSFGISYVFVPMIFLFFASLLVLLLSKKLFI